MEHLRVEIAEGVAVVTLDRPPVNALAHQTFTEITETFDALSASRDASVWQSCAQAVSGPSAAA